MRHTAIAAIAATAVLGFAGIANAGFVIIDTNGAPRTTVSPIPTNNDFRAELVAAGISRFELGTSLSVTPGPAGASEYFIDIEAFGSEAGYTNRFTMGTTSFTSPGNLSWGPRFVGTVPGGSGVMDFEFCALTISACISNVQNDNTGMESAQSIGMWVSEDGNTAWLLWDDSGARQDDNHDDLIIRLTYRVPEPATLGLLGLGLLGLGVVRRKRAVA
ncbi:MAG: PEP-CTERM sorting domain-containing protein [Steroidobacteraceae bacterium]|nr:PEP-CTERM sorting domain-containing protein [Steroidobacteraceae bacterium]